jgi:alkaline phosphatase
LALGALPPARAQQGAGAPKNAPKNVIVMIADGAGANVIAATGMYAGKSGKQVFDSAEWVKAWVSTYPLRTAEMPIAGAAGLAQVPDAVYDPAKNWDTSPVSTTTGRFADRFAGYAWTKRTAPDSANTMSAMANGHKSYNNAINVDGNGAKLTTFAELESRAGKAVGVVTTVEFSDATPAAAGGAHNVSRTNHCAIASEMLNAGVLGVIMGTGNPDYDNDGAKRALPNYDWIAASDWAALKSGTHASGFKLIQDRSEFEALAKNPNPPRKLMGIARAFNSTQANRAGAEPTTEAPYSVPRKTDVPDLPAMARAALNVLDKDRDGLFLMIEGGAVDRAEHADDIGRMIEEKSEFDDTVAAVGAYLDADTNGNNWSNTLVIVTADHDHLLLGPDSDTIPFQDLKDNGPGKVPGYRWQNNGHSNRLVPIFARGANADLITACAKRNDAYTDAQGRRFGRGAYLDQTEIFSVLTGAGCR